MKDKKEFYTLLGELDGQPFSEYEQLVGDFDFGRYVVKCAKINTDPENDVPPVFVVRVPQTIAEIPEYLFDSPVRRTAMEDFLLRKQAEEVEKIANFDYRGVARRHIIASSPSQSIIPRNALVLTKEYIEVRLQIILPVQQAIVDGEPVAAIDGEMMRQIFFEDLSEVICNSMLYCNMDAAAADYFVNSMEDSNRVRQHLGATGLVAFLEEGAMVTRLTDSDLPDYARLNAIEIEESLIEEIEVPHAENVKGVTIPAGLTLILGESNSGRVDIMDAIAQGIYNHVPGDGRENVLTVPDAVSIRTEVGRPVQNVNISAFVTELADGTNPATFSTPAAGSFTSQAASTVEAMEAGARVLLFDEHSSSSTFLSSDSRVSSLLGESSRHTLASRARQIVDDLGISIVVGGSSLVAEFIPIADKILKVENFRITDVTEEAKALEIEPTTIEAENITMASMLSRSRWIMPSSIDPSIGREDLLITTDDPSYLQFGRSFIDLEEIKQIADADQARAIGFVLYYAKLRYMDEGYPLREILDLIDRDLSNEGLSTLARELRGDLARPRRYEVAATLNRLPAFRVSHVTE